MALSSDSNSRITPKIAGEKSGAIYGTCKTMCPRDEVVMREKARMVHILEVSPSGEKKLVKCYSRSAADSVMAVPHLLRPYDVLLDTVQHLLFFVMKRSDVSAPVTYDFVNDRLRAVRQDMTIQRLWDHECVILLDPMIRFYVYYGYKLCHHPIKDYDPTLNRKYLLECLKWFFTCYEAITDMGKLLLDVHNVDITIPYIKTKAFKKGRKPFCDEPLIRTRCDRTLMESLYILCNLDDIHPMSRYWTLPKEWKSKKSVQLAYQIAAANSRGNYVRVCRLMEKLCPLTFCAVCMHLPQLQRRALQVASAAFARAPPAAALGGWLRLDAGGAPRLCAHYGLDAGDARWRRQDFRLDAPLHELIIPLPLETKMNLCIDHIFNYYDHE